MDVIDGYIFTVHLRPDSSIRLNLLLDDSCHKWRTSDGIG